MNDLAVSDPEHEESARALFAEVGFERATIRAIAKRAEVDPALVMQYFGSKQELFQWAVQAAPVAHGELGATRWSSRCSARSA
ncbi:helix-turn-helix domain-containing protein [Nonomuraea sp. B19D2]|uniref:helix-turn-helix domain-containing protein n=1 Tax=Nonomuraea sp. B19D2 TaxID=3159561 RepID=UPI0032DBE9FC